MYIQVPIEKKMNVIYMNIIQEAEEEERRTLLRLERRNLRDHNNIFELPHLEFRKCFRLNKDLVRHLIEQLTPHMNPSRRNTRVSVPNRILAALRFFAQGSYQRSVGNERVVPMAQQTFSRVLQEVCDAIEIIAPNWIQFPVTNEDKEIKKAEFMREFEFPGVVGCIDGTHVAILAPPYDEHLYFNRKRYHSKNVQIICDANLHILNVNANFEGATHDAFIWQNSVIKQQLETNYLRNDRNTWLLGDSGYPQEPWLMTPIVGAARDSPEGRYTTALTRARNCVERCIGVLKIRFRCILKERVLRYDPYKAGQIIITCCVLHNMCIRANIPLDDEGDYFENDEMDCLQVHNGLPGRHIFLLGQQQREQLINLYF